MSNFNITEPEVPSTEPNEFTKAEMADLSASKRNTILYERTIDSLNSHIDYLKGKLDESDTERKVTDDKLDEYIDDAYKVPTLRREITEMYVTFALSTVLMTVGSIFISGYPKTTAIVPWQFSLGWAMVAIGALFGIASKAIVCFYHRLTKEASS